MSGFFRLCHIRLLEAATAGEGWPPGDLDFSPGAMRTPWGTWSCRGCPSTASLPLWSCHILSSPLRTPCHLQNGIQSSNVVFLSAVAHTFCLCWVASCHFCISFCLLSHGPGFCYACCRAYSVCPLHPQCAYTHVCTWTHAHCYRLNVSFLPKLLYWNLHPWGERYRKMGSLGND